MVLTGVIPDYHRVVEPVEYNWFPRSIAFCGSEASLLKSEFAVMKFSVVTISFNQAEFLERAIQSVLNQTGVEIEYIIVDPGSTDGSREIIERYRPRLAAVILERDAGPADGLNRGFARATGDVLCYLNSDDEFLPGSFARVQAYLERHPDVDVVCGHAWVVDGKGEFLRKVWSDPYHPSMVAYGMSVQIQPSTFFRRSAFQRCKGFNIENRSNWDGELIIDLIDSGARLRVLDADLSLYRLHGVSLTNSGSNVARRQAWEARRFRRLMGRDPQDSDRYLRYFWWIRRQLRNPRAAFERLLRGRVAGRGVA